MYKINSISNFNILIPNRFNAADCWENARPYELEQASTSSAWMLYSTSIVQTMI